jgi:hypothetical protein
MASVIDPTHHLDRLKATQVTRSIGAQYLQSLKRSAAPVESPGAARKSFSSITCWKDTPQLYRKVMARVAGLSADVVEKIDRDLTETEKAMLRAAASDLRGYVDSLVRL